MFKCEVIAIYTPHIYSFQFLFSGMNFKKRMNFVRKEFLSSSNLGKLYLKEVSTLHRIFSTCSMGETVSCTFYRRHHTHEEMENYKDLAYYKLISIMCSNQCSIYGFKLHLWITFKQCMLSTPFIFFTALGTIF